VDDGVLLPTTTVNLPYGGDAVARALFWNLQHAGLLPAGMRPLLASSDAHPHERSTAETFVRNVCYFAKVCGWRLRRKGVYFNQLAGQSSPCTGPAYMLAACTRT